MQNGTLATGNQKKAKCPQHTIFDNCGDKKHADNNSRSDGIASIMAICRKQQQTTATKQYTHLMHDTAHIQRFGIERYALHICRCRAHATIDKKLRDNDGAGTTTNEIASPKAEASKRNYGLLPNAIMILIARDRLTNS